MENITRTVIRIKEKELATLDQRTRDRRSTLERQLATLDEQAKHEREKLEEELSFLRRDRKSVVRERV